MIYNKQNKINIKIFLIITRFLDNQFEDQLMKNFSSKSPCLQLQILTWDKDSHGLFDYEANKHQKDYFEIQGPCKLFRNWLTSQSCIYSNDKIKKGILPDQSFSFLASISLKHNGNFDRIVFINAEFVLSPPEKPSQDIVKRDGNAEDSGPINTNTYLVVRFYKDNSKGLSGFPMEPGNIVKLGRVEFKVVEVGGIPKRYQKKQQSFLGEFNGIHYANEKTEGTCKFCLCDESTDQNFMISPCNCKGSCEGVHVECLKMWIDSKVKKQVNGVVVTYNFTKFECQICKQPFPRMVIKQDTQIQMITIQKPKKPYIILEGINQRNQSKQQRCMHVICPQQGETVKIGRGHQCQIRLQDISVSRTHSQIKYYCGQFFITDQNSKFGTLVKLDREIQLNSKIKIQSGRSLFQFGLQ